MAEQSVLALLEDEVTWLEIIENDSACRYTRLGANTRLIRMRSAIDIAKSAAPDTAAERDRLLVNNAELASVVTEWLPIVQRQLDGLLMAAEKVDGAKSLFETAAWKTANEGVERMRAALSNATTEPDHG